MYDSIALPSPQVNKNPQIILPKNTIVFLVDIKNIPEPKFRDVEPY